MAITLLYVPTSSHHQTLFSPRPHVSNNSTNCNSLTTLTISRCPAKPILAPLLCTSSSTSSAPVAEDSDAAIPVASESAALQQSEGLPFSGCKTCGKEEIERGCNGEGRIQGGIATVPGFGWWPIKAYRPCPGFVASGGRYRRQGQSMDEVAFGRGERGTSVGANTEVETEKKRRDPRRFKR